jgi:ABC-type thiamine transport system substrate-binding protein
MNNDPPILNGRPTQRPLNRDEQKTAFEHLKTQYFQEPVPTPQWQLPAIKDYKLTEAEQLQAVQKQFQERNLQQSLAKVEERLEEKKTADTIKTFYCRHTFQSVRASWMVFPIKYKICSKCGLVK